MADVQIDPTTEPVDELDDVESVAVPSWTPAPGRENGITIPWAFSAP